MEINTTKNQQECADKLISNRNWIDAEIQKHLDNSNLPYEIKKLVGDISSSLVLYIQENSSEIFNYSSKDEK